MERMWHVSEEGRGSPRDNDHNLCPAWDNQRERRERVRERERREAGGIKSCHQRKSDLRHSTQCLLGRFFLQRSSPPSEKKTMGGGCIKSWATGGTMGTIDRSDSKMRLRSRPPLISSEWGSLPLSPPVEERDWKIWEGLKGRRRRGKKYIPLWPLLQHRDSGGMRRRKRKFSPPPLSLSGGALIRRSRLSLRTMAEATRSGQLWNWPLEHEWYVAQSGRTVISFFLLSFCSFSPLSLSLFSPFPSLLFKECPLSFGDNLWGGDEVRRLARLIFFSSREEGENGRMSCISPTPSPDESINPLTLLSLYI